MYPSVIPALERGVDQGCGAAWRFMAILLAALIVDVTGVFAANKRCPPNDFDVRQFLPYLLNQAVEASSLEFQKVYKDKYGTLRKEWRVLFYLGIYGRMTASDIGAWARMHKTKISREVQRLAGRRCLTRTRAKQDRRWKYLTLTVVGQQIYGDLKRVVQAYDPALTDGMSDEEADTLRRLLLRLAQRGSGSKVDFDLG